MTSLDPKDKLHTDLECVQNVLFFFVQIIDGRLILYQQNLRTQCKVYF